MLPYQIGHFLRYPHSSLVSIKSLDGRHAFPDSSPILYDPLFASSGRSGVTLKFAIQGDASSPIPLTSTDE